MIVLFTDFKDDAVNETLMASVRGGIIGQKCVEVAKLIATMIKFIQSKSSKLVNYSAKVASWLITRAKCNLLLWVVLSLENFWT